MVSRSKIEWTDATWNPVTGCTKISSGCKNCYAERMAKRLQKMGSPGYSRRFEVTLHPKRLNAPLSWRSPQVVFVNSMSDLFHASVLEFIRQVFDTIRNSPRHRFQVLTKRAERLEDLSPELEWPENLWMGVSVEAPDVAWRIDHLRRTGARVKFLSVEPLLAPLPGLDLGGIDWVIVGGESGPRARRMDELWVTDIRDQCLRAGVPFFFKQWGGVRKKDTGRVLEGRTWDEMPAGA